MFDKKLLDTLPDDYYTAINELTSTFLSFYSDDEDREKNYDKYLSAFGFLEVFLESHSVKTKHQTVTGSVDDDIKYIFGIFRTLFSGSLRILRKRVAIDKVENAKQEYLSHLGKGIHYDFSENDIKKIQSTINKLRKIITESKDISEEHKNRLLKKLEKLQSELHKKMSNLDSFYGLLMDFSIVFGKIGKNIKPLVDQVKVIADIIFKIIAKAEGLPSGFKIPLLESKKDDEI